MEDEIKFLKGRVAEKEQAILDLEKKVRLAEFRTKKQVQEATTMLETTNIKLEETERRLAFKEQELTEQREKVEFFP